jgi:N-acetylneuraminate synthase/N,N'-diacetyllegionaminate synthase
MEIIAEIGQNHNGDLGLAKELICMAAAGGANVAKFQVYDARTLFSKENNPWYEYNCRTELSRSQIESLAATCREVGVEFMASVFDVERISWLESVGVGRYKIASRSIRDTALIAALARTRKPLIVSLGFWGESKFPVIETSAPVDFLYCVSKYPTPLEDVGLARVDFERYAGFSDHTLGMTASMAALARGARIIEKHLTLDKAMEGPDHACSMDPGELRVLCQFRDELARCL